MVAASETKIAIGLRRGRKPDLSVYMPAAMPALTDALVREAPNIVVEVATPRPRGRFAPVANLGGEGEGLSQAG